MLVRERFHYDILGLNSEKKLVFLHGLMGRGLNWRKITPHFEKEYQILIFDQRGHGKSFHPPKGYAPEDYAQDLEDILEELGWKEVYLVGHSMGARNAMSFSAKFTHRVKKLVVEDIGPHRRGEALVRIKRSFGFYSHSFCDKSRC